MPNYIGAMGLLPPSINELRLQEDARQFDLSNGMGNISALLSLLMRKRESDADNAFRDKAFEEDRLARLRAEADARIARAEAAGERNYDRHLAFMGEGLARGEREANSPLRLAQMYADATRRGIQEIPGGGTGWGTRPRDPAKGRALSALLGIQGNQTGLGPSVAGGVNSALMRQEGAMRAAEQAKAAQMAERLAMLQQPGGTNNYYYMPTQEQPAQEAPYNNSPLNMEPFPEDAQDGGGSTFEMATPRRKGSRGASVLSALARAIYGG